MPVLIQSIGDKSSGRPPSRGIFFRFVFRIEINSAFPAQQLDCGINNRRDEGMKGGGPVWKKASAGPQVPDVYARSGVFFREPIRSIKSR